CELRHGARRGLLPGARRRAPRDRARRPRAVPAPRGRARRRRALRARPPILSGGPSRPTLDEARARLKELGYLTGSVERYVFRRALESGRGRAAGGFALLAAVAGLSVWLVGTLRLGPERAASALLWGIPVCAFAPLAAATAPPACLARRVAGSGRLPQRRRRASRRFV